MTSVKLNTTKQDQCDNCDLGHLCFPDKKDLTPASLKSVVQQEKTFKRGEAIFRNGEPFEYLTAICTGSIKTSQLTNDGQEQVTGFHFVGDLLGMDAIGERKYRYDATALEPTRVREISYDRLVKLAASTPAVQRALHKLMGDQLIFDHELLMPMVGKKSAAQQLASYITALSRRHQRRGFPDKAFRLTMSRNDIANYLGLAKETVSRLFSRLESEGLVETKSRNITLKNPGKLAAIAKGNNLTD